MNTSAENKEAATEKIELQIIRGLPISLWFKKEIVEAILDHMPQDDDVIIATYPKTGTTWMQYIVHQILTRGESFPTFNDMVDKVVPYLEMSGISAIEAMTTKPRVYRHHFPYDKVQKNLNAKIIYVYRKPEDTFVSYYHFVKNLNLCVEFDEYFENFLSGNIPYGRYFEHVLSYLKHIDNGNILMVSYEKLLIQTREEILRVAKFLGDDHYDILTHDKTLIDKIIQHTSFDYMKQNLSLTMPKDRKKAFRQEQSSDDIQKNVSFFRKGVSGDGKKTLSDHQLTRLRDVTKEIMKGTKILDEWLQD